MSEKLSKPQTAVVQLMKANPQIEWWTRHDLGPDGGIARRSTLEALVRRGVCEGKYFQSYAQFWRLVPEAERVPVADLDIPF